MPLCNKHSNLPQLLIHIIWEPTRRSLERFKNALPIHRSKLRIPKCCWRVGQVLHYAQKSASVLNDVHELSSIIRNR